MGHKQLKFSGHAIKQMFERQISKEDVCHAIDNGETIKSYPEDKPYPNKLMLGFSGNRPIHVVLAYDDVKDVQIIITTYIPDPKLWSKDFKVKRR